MLVAPPFTALPRVKEAIGRAPILLSGQNMHWEAQGAFTGEVSAAMLADAGCTHVILGHSERRTLFGETDDVIDRKAAAAVKKGLIPIVCIGETLEEREKGLTFQIIERQLSLSLKSFREGKDLPPTTLLAYEPVWAIGTGRTATPEQAQEVHQRIRQWLKAQFGERTAESIRILYGGSVKPDNARDLMSNPTLTEPSSVEPASNRSLSCPSSTSTRLHDFCCIPVFFCYYKKSNFARQRAVD